MEPIKAKDLAAKLLEHPDFDVIVEHTYAVEGQPYGFNLDRFIVTGIADIGHSDKKILLSMEID